MPCHIFKLLEIKHIWVEGERKYAEDVEVNISKSSIHTTPPPPIHTYTYKHGVLQRRFLRNLAIISR